MSTFPMQWAWFQDIGLAKQYAAKCGWRDGLKAVVVRVELRFIPEPPTTQPADGARP
jgi:hypothetical protein